MATKKRRRFAEGGIAADKEAGLKASQGEKVGFFERLRMGNIDDEGSEAYRRFGAGRAKADRDMANEAAAMKAVDASRAAASLSSSDDADSGAFYEAGSGVENDTKPSMPKRRASTQAAKPSAPAKAAPKMQEQTYRRTSGDSGERSRPDTSNYSNEGRGRVAPKPLVEQIPRDKSTVVGGERVSGSELGRNIANTALALGPGRLGGLSTIPAEIRGAKGAQEAYNKAATARRTAEMRANADVTKFASKPKATQTNPAKTTKKFDDEEAGIEFKRGGKVKKPSMPMKKMASGGMTSGASKRGDGIAQRGKTRGRIY